MPDFHFGVRVLCLLSQELTIFFTRIFPLSLSKAPMPVSFRSWMPQGDNNEGKYFSATSPEKSKWSQKSKRARVIPLRPQTPAETQRKSALGWRSDLTLPHSRTCSKLELKMTLASSIMYHLSRVESRVKENPLRNLESSWGWRRAGKEADGRMCLRRLRLDRLRKRESNSVAPLWKNHCWRRDHSPGVPRRWLRKVR